MVSMFSMTWSTSCAPGQQGRTEQHEQGTEGGASRDGVVLERYIEGGGRELNNTTDAAEHSAPDLVIEPAKEATKEDLQEPPLPDTNRPESTPEPSKPCTLPTTAPETRVKSWKDVQVDGQWLSLSHDGCGLTALRIVAAKSQQIKVEVQAITPGETLKLGVYNARRMYKVAQDPLLVSGQNKAFEDWISLTATIDQSGEIGLILDGNKKAVTYQLRLICDGNCKLESTRFPTVFLHGFLGTDTYLNIVDYFFELGPHLEKYGYSVFFTKVQPIAQSAQRIVKLAPQIDDIMTKTGARKINLIGHSQGGIDGRLLIAKAKYGDRVSTLTTVSSPHLGVPVPNLLIEPSKELGEKNMKQYNKDYPNDPRVKYYSWAGVSCAPLEFSCRKKYDDEVVDPIFITLYRTIQGLRGANDGVITVDSAKWGTFLGLLHADHMDEVGQIADKNNKPFKHKDFYLSEMRRLTKAGF